MLLSVYAVYAPQCPLQKMCKRGLTTASFQVSIECTHSNCRQVASADMQHPTPPLLKIHLAPKALRHSSFPLLHATRINHPDFTPYHISCQNTGRNTTHA